MVIVLVSIPVAEFYMIALARQSRLVTGHRPKGTRYRPTPQEGWSQHVPRTAQMSLRPIRFAFRVRPDDKKGTAGNLPDQHWPLGGAVHPHHSLLQAHAKPL